MALIVFYGKELQTSPPYCSRAEARRTPGQSRKTPRKISEKYSEFETLLRDAFRLRNAQKKASRTKPEDSKGTTKAR
jgi:hypothetical protein